MQKLYIVRHGKTDWNVQGLMQGSIDISLNEEGIKKQRIWLKRWIYLKLIFVYVLH